MVIFRQVLGSREPGFAVRKREVLLARLVDPLWVAGQLLCTAAGYLPVVGIRRADRDAKVPGERQRIEWTIHTAQGPLIAFLLEDVVLLHELYMQDGRRLTQEILGEHMKLQHADLFDEFSFLSSKVQKEIARLPEQHVADAIQVARQLPILACAELLCQKLRTGETVQKLYAGLRMSSGNFVWYVETEKRLAHFAFVSDPILLVEGFSMKKLAALSNADLRRATEAEIKGRA
ncbi:hypothetical protein [Bradyrhizobium sp. Ai1a-2]|uniref:hypothetical protein n=1 Tax=Bradyrhizobium sp. Ai1a-2 TaxID=196490 RepID=UPI000420A6EE|nr:hypothetical protein [Bradyrhizobium sp. Ai1a-2]